MERYDSCSLPEELLDWKHRQVRASSHAFAASIHRNLPTQESGQQVQKDPILTISCCTVPCWIRWRKGHERKNMSEDLPALPTTEIRSRHDYARSRVVYLVVNLVVRSTTLHIVVLRKATKTYMSILCFVVIFDLMTMLLLLSSSSTMIDSCFCSGLWDDRTITRTAAASMLLFRSFGGSDVQEEKTFIFVFFSLTREKILYVLDNCRVFLYRSLYVRYCTGYLVSTFLYTILCDT